MKKVICSLICLFTMLVASLGLRAQGITITINPGWNWICYPNATVVGIDEAFDGFTPVEGDVIKSQSASASYNNGQWRGSLTQFDPGSGYLYYSNRNEVVGMAFGQNYDVSLTTDMPTGITAVNAMGSGVVILPEGAHMFQCGLCWDSIPIPDVDDGHSSIYTDTVNFICSIDGLVPNTTYYMRTYVVTENGLYYGNEVSFSSQSIGIFEPPAGALDGVFSVSASERVFFSEGNLEFVGSASTPYWQFAENQWDCYGSTSGQNSSNQSVNRDLFGWGTSGYNHGANCYQPWKTSVSNTDYYVYGQYSNNLYDQTGKADWGYNPIRNGGNQTNKWRTLTTKEWLYVLNSRTTPSGIRYAKAKVNNVNGLILLPDYWSTVYFTLYETNTSDASFNSNIISASQWNALEQHGAVFLPAAGYREGTSLTNAGSFGYYWSSSYSSSFARNVRFDDSNVSPQQTQYRGYGCSVRLVRNVE